jgi:CRP-like cAMP-binding protein
MMSLNVSEALIHFFEMKPELATEIANRFKLQTIPKGTPIIKQGELVTKLYFLESGLLRIFINTEAKEVTQWISTPGYFLTEIGALYGKKPSRWSLEALTDAQVWSIGIDSLTQLETDFPEWVKYERAFIVKCFETIENRVFSHLALSAEERYNQFLLFAPELFNEVPLKYLASLLGMTPETLSRLRAKRT